MVRTPWAPAKAPVPVPAMIGCTHAPHTHTSAAGSVPLACSHVWLLKVTLPLRSCRQDQSRLRFQAAVEALLAEHSIYGCPRDIPVAADVGAAAEQATAQSAITGAVLPSREVVP